MSHKITSPFPGLNARSTFGGQTVEFRDGVAEIDEIPAGLRMYLLGAGYKVDAQDDGDHDVLDQNVATILETVAGYDADALVDLARREAAGRGRKGLLEGLDKLTADADAADGTPAADADPDTAPGEDEEGSK